MSLLSPTVWSKAVGRGWSPLSRRPRKRRRSRGASGSRFNLLECRALLSTLTVTNTHDSGPGSLRAAITTANAQPVRHEDCLRADGFGDDRPDQRPADDHQPPRDRRPGAGTLAVSGQDASRAFVIDGGTYGGAGKVSINGLTIEDGLATSDLAFPPSGGGILDLMAGLTLDGCVLGSNQAPLGGAGAMIYRGSLTASNSTWSNNVILGNPSSTTVGSDTLGSNGSGVNLFASVATINSGTFTSNIPLNPGVYTAGGGISAEDGSTVTVSGSTFVGNQTYDGGGISVTDGSTLTVSHRAFDGNQVGNGG